VVHTLDEAAAILRVKPSWLERQAAARKIPFTMLGGSYRFTAEHLAAIVRQHEQRPVIASAEELSRTAARQATATQLPNDIKVKPLRPRPRRAA
jgi:excisionase family DNA binding protein